MIDILPTLALCTQHADPDVDRVHLWALVLASRHCSYRIEKGPCLLVPPEEVDQAVSEILAYERENRPPVPLPRLPDNSLASYLILMLFLCFLSIVDTRLPGGLSGWADFAYADSGLILSGQWARCLTALMVHADSAHLLSNLAALAVLMPMLAKECGSGPAWWFFIASGTFGNALNAWTHGPGHASVGASTGVFGVIAVLAVGAGFARSGSRMLRVLLALGAGMSLLALLGSAGERTDLGAHLFGFVCGAVLGGLGGLLPSVWTRKQPGNALWGGFALLATVGASWLVLN